MLFSMATIMAQEHTHGDHDSHTHGDNEPHKHNVYFDHTPEEVFKDDPGRFAKFKQRSMETRKLMDARKGQKVFAKKMNNYIIPVVFHIYGSKYPNDLETGESRDVTEERVIQALNDVNANFKGFNDTIDPTFANVEGGMNVEFKLAQIDPDGNTTNGIIYHEVKEGFGLETVNNDEIAKYAWDNYKYFNIHVQLVINSGSTVQSGIAWLPNELMSDLGIARVVYNGRYLIYDPPASSLTHEFGHWMGLLHTFEEGCIADPAKGDQVADTPPTANTRPAAANGGRNCNPGPFNNCLGRPINYDNHMDYNPCERMFTKGQVARMEDFMENDPSRFPLWQDANLIATGV